MITRLPGMFTPSIFIWNRPIFPLSAAVPLWCTTEVNPAGADGLFYGSADTLIAQLISIVVAYALAIVGSYILFKIVNLITPMRANEDEEISGIDIVEHGERAYNQSIVSADSILSSSVADFAPVNAKPADVK